MRYLKRPSTFHRVWSYLDAHLTRWAKQKYERLRRHHRRARHWLQRIMRRQPRLFAHWPVLQSTAGQ
jgi:RNA-directed DNA polymerase